MDATRSLALLLAAANTADLAARAAGMAPWYAAAPAQRPPARSLPARPRRPTPAPAPAKRIRVTAENFVPRFEMPWQNYRDLRLRLVYREAVGQTWGDEGGFHLFEFGRALRSIAAAVPAKLRGPIPVYALGSAVPFDIELQNIGQTPLDFLRIQARQESYEPSGRRGAPIGARSDVLRVGSLKPGETAVLAASVRLVGEALPQAGLINLEQTHVLVTQETPRGLDILLDAPQAGIIDPPFWADRSVAF